MPLSEHEERALAEIARQLQADDPKFVATVAKTSPTRHHLRRLRWSAIGFVLGLITLLGLTFHLAFGVAGFLIMLLSVAAGATALRSLGSDAGDTLTELRRSFQRRSRR